MKVLKLNKSAPSFDAAIKSLRQGGSCVFNRADCGWASAPDNHGFSAPVLVKEYSDISVAMKEGCPAAMRMVFA